MVHDRGLRRLRDLRAAIVASLIVMFVLSGCTETQSDGATGGGRDATATPESSLTTLSNSSESPSSTPATGEQALAAVSPGTETQASPAATQPGTPNTEQDAKSSTPAADDAGDSASDTDYTYSDTSLASAGGGGGTNHIQVINKNDGKRKINADLQLNHIPGPRVEPSNAAVAYASCEGCETLAIALQINLISHTATYVAPENVALAVNYECTNCYTVARAVQYTISVDDPTQVPPEVNELLKQLDTELKEIRKEGDLSIDEVEERINAVIVQFRDLAESLKDDRKETQDATTPGATPITDNGTPTVEASPTSDVTRTTEPSSPSGSPTSETPTPAATPSDPTETTTATLTMTETATP